MQLNKKSHISFISATCSISVLQQSELIDMFLSSKQLHLLFSSFADLDRYEVVSNCSLE